LKKKAKNEKSSDRKIKKVNIEVTNNLVAQKAEMDITLFKLGCHTITEK